MDNTPAPAAASVGAIRFPVASRPMRRFSNVQTVSNLAGATSFAPIPLPATGWVRRVRLYFTLSATAASAAAVVAGDGPFNAISAVSIADATGQPIYQPISGYNLYLVNKYLSLRNIPWANPHMGPNYAFASTSTVLTATFCLDLDFEEDPTTGYGAIPNLDSNASLLLKIDVGAYSNYWNGTTVSASTVAVRVQQDYWAPVGSTTGGIPNQTSPAGFGDFVETRYETQTVTASSENTVNINNRGGLVKGFILVSRNAGTRTAFTAATNVGTVYDNNAIDEGVTLELYQDALRELYGYQGADLTTSYAPLTAGVLPGLDAGVLAFPFALYGGKGSRNTWLNTRVGTLLQTKVTPGASATQLEIVTQLAQVKDANAFYGVS